MTAADMRARRIVSPSGETRVEFPRPAGSDYMVSCDATWIPVTECMKDPICVSPDLSLSAAAALFLEAGISGAPVVDRFGELLGVVSKTDVARQPMATIVAEVMNLHPVAVPETATLGEAAAVIVEHRLRRAPVVSKTGHVVGVVGPLDLLEWVI